VHNFKMPEIPTLHNTDPKKKVPSGVKNIQKKKPAPIPAEADAVPSKNYHAIITSKLLKGKAGTMLASLPARAIPSAAVSLTRGITGYLERCTKRTSLVSLCRHLASIR
jgi:hypothetical protein